MNECIFIPWASGDAGLLWCNTPGFDTDKGLKALFH
jgi:hypothetical protein